MDAQWQPGFHDPTVVGWVITAAYLLATILCLRVGRLPGPSQHRLTWVGLTVLLVFLTLNKQLDFQTWMRYAGRDYTRDHALYAHKEEIRLVFMALLLLATAAFIFTFRMRLIRFLKNNKFIASGLFLIASFIVIRGVNFDRLGALRPLELLPEAWQWLLELTGITLILVALFRHLQAPNPALPIPQSR